MSKDRKTNTTKDTKGKNSSQKEKNPFPKPDLKDLKKPKMGVNWLYIAIFAFLGYMLFENMNPDKNVHEISLSEFETILNNKEVDSIIIFDQKRLATAFLNKTAAEKEEHANASKGGVFGAVAKIPYYTFRYGDLQLFQKNLDQAKADDKLLQYKLESSSDWGMLIGNALPFILLIGVWIYIMRRMSGGAAGGGGGQIFNIGKSRAKLFDQDQKVKTSFKDVAGLEGAKEEMEEIVDFLKNPEKYTSLGGKTPKGALLVGPPGTGKTLIAKAVAGEANVPFYSLSGSDFVEMFVGVGASRVRDLFKQAKQKAPSIIFIDEIDAIGRARGKNNMTGGNDERENTLNQLLTEMDGFGTDTNVIVIAATNRSDVLDKALLRAGRFDRQIYVDLPDRNERKAIFEVHIKPLKLAKDIDLEFLSKQTPGFSGADIANVCNEAALVAARKGKKAVHHQDFLDAVDRIIGGLEKKNKIVTELEKKTIAFHEAGHATVSWMTEHAAPLVKVTIVPRGRSLGAAWYLPEERMIVKTDQMLDEMCATLGGRAAEKVIFNEISTGALNDLEKVTKQARAMVTIYGLNEKIGNLTYYDSSGQEYGFTKPYSEDTAKLIDEEISKIIEEQYQRAIKILEEHKDKLTILAEKLLVKEVIFQDDLETIFGKRPHETKLIEEDKSEVNSDNKSTENTEKKEKK
jgi:cell division protease FtsH